jgi:hypothetical protein
VQNDTGLGTSLAEFTADFTAANASSATKTRTAYGLGFELSWVDGQTRVFHHGGLAGIAATFTALPAQGVGYAVAINTSGAATRDRLAGLLQASVLPSAKAAPAIEAVASTTQPSPAEATAAVPDTALPASTWRRWQGVYTSAWLGPVQLCGPAHAPTLQVQRSPRLKANLGANNKRQVTVRWQDPMVDSDAHLVAVATQAGRVTRFVVQPLGESDFDFSYLHFKRVAPCRQPDNPHSRAKP